MIIQKDYYKRNKKTGDIVKRQKIWVKCEICGEEWETLYEYIKYRKLKKILCKDCRAKNRHIRRKCKKKKKIYCYFCGKELFRSVHLIKEQNFCSKQCSDKSYLQSKYEHLEKIFDKNLNDVAYLFGLILGDGHFKKTEQKKTTRISIAFNAQQKKLISIFEKIAKKLEINYFTEPKIHNNCQMIGFVLPDKLLKKYNLCFNGSKYKEQPSINKNLCNNINFIIGMINSDGCHYLTKKKYETIWISGTVKSIIDSCCDCLYVNDIDYRLYYYKGRIDKRNGNLNKGKYLINISKKNTLKRLKEKISFKIKELSNA